MQIVLKRLNFLLLWFQSPKDIHGDATNESQFNESSSSDQSEEGPSSIPDMESHSRKKIKRIPVEVATKTGLTITDHIENLTSKVFRIFLR